MMSDRLPRRTRKRLDKYERRFKWPLLIVSLLYLVLVFVEMLPGVRMGPALMLIDGAFWLVFVIDYVWRVFFLAAPKRWAYAREWLCLLDLVVIASFPVLFFLNAAFLGLARIARTVRIASQLLRGVRVGAQGGRTVDQARQAFSRRQLLWVIPLALLVGVFASVYVWRFEAVHEGASINNPGDAIWWAVVTLLTGGGGDLSPHTDEGRVAAAVLMLVGITVIGLITAALASLLIDNDKALNPKLHKKLDEILDHQATMQKRIEELDEILDHQATMQKQIEALTRAPSGAVPARPDTPSGDE